MTDPTLSPSIEARQQRPYSSLYAALLLQSFQDALAEAMSEDPPSDREEATATVRRAAAAGSPALALQA